MDRVAEMGAEEVAPQNPRTLPEAEATEALEMIDALEQDDDVQRVFHSLA